MEEHLITKFSKKLEYWEPSSLKKIHQTSLAVFAEYPGSGILRIKKGMTQVTRHNEDWVRPQLPLTF